MLWINFTQPSLRQNYANDFQSAPTVKTKKRYRI
ncbi:Uncharacterised protein [Legionella hackeliae]|nr:Uncharacterised protein [Legionella hackeliae]